MHVVTTACPPFVQPFLARWHHEDTPIRRLYVGVPQPRSARRCERPWWSRLLQGRGHRWNRRAATHPPCFPCQGEIWADFSSKHLRTRLAQRRQLRSWNCPSTGPPTSARHHRWHAPAGKRWVDVDVSNHTSQMSQGRDDGSPPSQIFLERERERERETKKQVRKRTMLGKGKIKLNCQTKKKKKKTMSSWESEPAMEERKCFLQCRGLTSSWNPGKRKRKLQKQSKKKFKPSERKKKKNMSLSSWKSEPAIEDACACAMHRVNQFCLIERKPEQKKGKVHLLRWIEGKWKKKKKKTQPQNRNFPPHFHARWSRCSVSWHRLCQGHYSVPGTAQSYLWSEGKQSKKLNEKLNLFFF